MQTEEQSLSIPGKLSVPWFASSSFYFALIAALAAVTLFAYLHRGDLGGYDDAAYAHEAKQILRSNDWLGVRLNGYLDFDKPPLFVWCDAVSLKVLGISDFAAKFPAALFGFGAILLVYFITRELTNGFWPPIIAMFVMTTSQPFTKYAMHAMTCVPYTFFFLLAMFAYVKSRETPPYLLLCGVATGLADLTRAPVGWIPLVIIVLHLIVTRQTRLLWTKYMMACFLIAVLLPAIWYAAEYQRYGSEFFAEHFGNILKHSVGENRTRIQLVLELLKYPYWLLLSYWPWLPLMVVGLVTQSKKMFRERDATASLLVIWVVCVLVPFSLATSKALRYILPAFPAFSVLCAIILDTYVPSKWKVIGFRVAYALVCVLLIVMIPLPNYLVRARDMRTLAPVAQAATVPSQRVVLYNFGERRWDYLNELIWYGDRLSETTEDLNTVRLRLDANRDTVVIMDKSAFAHFNAEHRFDIEILGESDKFLCFRRSRPVAN
jgi:4-amino-4-deoxy-L-arabinose transferase-like glycosyltransferase